MRAGWRRARRLTDFWRDEIDRRRSSSYPLPEEIGKNGDTLPLLIMPGRSQSLSPMASTLKIAIIADDLTGAMDAAAPFAKRGAHTRVLFSDNPRSAELINAPEVLARTTDSRHLDPVRAIQRVYQALSDLEDRLPFKKIDSTLRGNIVPETLAVLEATGRRHLLITPAFPGQGRVLRGGEVFIHDVPLAETAIAKDALSPPMRIPLVMAFGGKLGVFVHEIDRPLDLQLAPGEAVHVYIVDAENDNDLLRLAQFALAHRDEVVVAGSSGLGNALAVAIYGSALNLKVRRDAQPLLYIVGSRTPQSAAQLERLVDFGAQLIVIESHEGNVDLERAIANLARLDPNKSAYVLTLRQRDKVIPEASLVANALATVGHRLISELDVGAIIVTGGDTAQALMAELAVESVDLAGELMPGIAIGIVPYRQRNFKLVTKAGGFGDPELFVTLMKELRAK
ncbi:MAG: four-carbon acid sugar kinase family protein [Burkholderiales bacterium]